jgi:polysaccharide deacetylase family protein (PEP-CTERM system associated)
MRSSQIPSVSMAPATDRSDRASSAAFTVDVEDWYHPELVRRHGPPRDPRSRVEASTAPILDLLERHGTLATFFVVGEVIRSAPSLLRRIASAGHEIGCHTHTHRPLWDLTPESFREELREFRAAVGGILPGVEVRGFRAPTFSMDHRTTWALEVLAEEGYTYDSSVVPTRGPLYGCPGAPLGIYRPAPGDLSRHDPSGPIVEFPAPVVALPGWRVPVGGGFYLRQLPWFVYKRLVASVLRRRDFFLYLHPWETDSAAPRHPLPLAARVATYRGISGMLSKVERLLRSFRFTTMREVVKRSVGA